MTDNQVIHEAMGFKWRKITTNKREFNCSSTRTKFIDFVCECCDGPQSACGNEKPDYAFPEHYCRLMDWMRNNGYVDKLDSWFFDTYEQSMGEFLNYNRAQQVALIAEAIKEGVLK